MTAANSSLPTIADAYVEPYLNMGVYSGAILLAKDGEVLLSKGYGMANYELDVSNTPQTKFRIASVSKPLLRWQ
jgi:CubicO group peptidase (beta-lactamase class C family)